MTSLKRLTLSTRIWIVVALCLGVGGGAIGFLAFELKATSERYERALRNVQESARRMDAARLIQVTFKKQVQEWKDTLLRGSDPDDLAKYSGQFHAEANKVAQLGSALQASVGDAAQRGSLDSFLRSFTVMQNNYELALSAFVKASGRNQHEVDAMVKGQDRKATDLLDKTVETMVAQANAAVASEKEAVTSTIRWAVTSVLVLFAAIGVAVSFIIRGFSFTLRRAVQDLAESAGQVTNAAAYISASSQSLAQGASQQAASI